MTKTFGGDPFYDAFRYSSDFRVTTSPPLRASASRASCSGQLRSSSLSVA